LAGLLAFILASLAYGNITFNLQPPFHEHNYSIKQGLFVQYDIHFTLIHNLWASFKVNDQMLSLPNTRSEQASRQSKQTNTTQNHLQ
jgi:hypothetical protein